MRFRRAVAKALSARLIFVPSRAPESSLPSKSNPALASAVCVLVGATHLLIVIAGCSPRGGRASGAPQATPPEFVGNAACAECHPREHQAHKGTHHDLALRPASAAGLQGVAPRTGMIPRAGLRLVEDGEGLLVRREFPVRRDVRLHLAVGSGKYGMTFVSFLDDRHLMELRWSYFPPWNWWALTPGQEVRLRTDDPLGRVQDAEMSRRCMGCHTTALPEGRAVPEPSFFGVGCEACHGPGRAHIQAARIRQRDLRMEKLDRLPPSRLNGLCGRCHRSTAALDLTSPEASQTHRFQPHGLQRSACRTEGGQPLSCLGCHNPHTDAETDHRAYERICLACHAVPPAAAPGPRRPAASLCPVNPREGCIRCHMERRSAFPTAGIPATMVDHRIAIPAARR